MVVRFENERKINKISLVSPILKVIARRNVSPDETRTDILVATPDRIGDFILLLPIINRLKKSRYKVDLLTAHPPLKYIAEELGIFNRVVFRPKLFDIVSIGKLIVQLRKVRYKAVLIPAALRVSLSRYVLTEGILRDAFSVGFAYPGAKYDETIDLVLEHDQLQNVRLLKPLNLEVSNDDYAFPLHDKWINKAKEILMEWGVSDDNYIVIQPTTLGRKGHKDKCWPGRKYVDLMNLIIRNTSLKIILLGSGDEFELCNRLASDVGDNRVIVQAGKTEFFVAAGILKLSKMFIGNDSGLMHIAAILKKPMLILWGPTDFRKLGYFSKNQFIVSLGLECSPCEDTKHEKKCMHRLCLEGIDVGDVFVKVELLLSNMEDTCKVK